ncbi:MAG TPA: hypothetical protein VJB94_01400 [Candidatus Nanoarchaeia archaeon]|nr:hypothetical protein [Candidatus Nanoarchaeia archaeon]
MKKIYFLLLIIFLTACASKYSFEGGFKLLEKADEKYGASYKAEQINGTLADFYKINDYIEYLEDYKKDLKEAKQTNDTDALITFVNARISMLESQRYFQLGRSIGSAGFVVDTFTCNEISQIEETTIYWNKSFHYGLNATSTLDDLLIKYPQYRPLVGIDNKKAAFYASPLGYLVREVRRNKDSVKLFCNVDIRGT